MTLGAAEAKLAIRPPAELVAQVARWVHAVVHSAKMAANAYLWLQGEKNLHSWLVEAAYRLPYLFLEKFHLQE